MIHLLLKPLIAGGLSLLADAVTTKGKEFVEEKTGIKLSENMPEQDLVKLKQFEAEHEEELLELSVRKAELSLQELQVVANVAMNEDTQVSNRWTADTSSESWLAQNIRPMCLIAIMVTYTVFALMSAAGWNVNAGYVELLGQWGMLIMGAYFGGRTIEKVLSARRDTK